MKFLDSNVLIYAAEDTQADKFARACDIVEAAVCDNGFVISAQVLNEFASVRLYPQVVLIICSILPSLPYLPEPSLLLSQS